MSKSPLSGAFAESSATTKKKNKKNGAILLIAGIALTSSIGGVFAANSITVNAGNEIEFGQGVAATNACQTSTLDTKVTQSFVTGDTFRVDEVQIAGIDGTECSSTVFRVALIGDSGEITSHNLPATSDTTRTWEVSTTVTADLVRSVAVTTEEN